MICQRPSGLLAQLPESWRPLLRGAPEAPDPDDAEILNRISALLQTAAQAEPPGRVLPSKRAARFALDERASISRWAATDALAWAFQRELHATAERAATLPDEHLAYNSAWGRLMPHIAHACLRAGQLIARAIEGARFCIALAPSGDEEFSWTGEVVVGDDEILYVDATLRNASLHVEGEGISLAIKTEYPSGIPGITWEPYHNGNPYISSVKELETSLTNFLELGSFADAAITDYEDHRARLAAANADLNP